MSDLGQLLRKARLEQKISLEDLQETTKIRKRYLEAIEEGNYKVLPGNFYVRAFIKSYSEAVGLDPNEVLRLYQNVIPAPEPEHIEPIRSKRTTRNTERIGRWLSSVMMVAFVVLILGIIYYYININYKGGVSDASQNLPKTVTDKVQQQSTTPGTEGGTPGAGTNPQSGASASTPPQTVTPPPPAPPASEVKLARSERGIDYYTITGTDKMKIELSITGDACWVELDSLGDSKKVLESQTFTGGTTKSWEMNVSSFMIFGKANAAELKVNGTPIPLGDAPNVKKIQIDFQKT